MKFEVVYWTQDGCKSIEVESFAEARQVAKAKSRESGRTAIVRRKPSWRILIVDIESGAMLDTGGSLTKFEASIVWRKWQHRTEKAVCVPWPNGVNWRSIRAG